MATTYTLIASNTLSSSAASVAFTGIPQTFTDLVARYSIRNDAGYAQIFDDVTAGGGNSWTRIEGDGSSATSARQTGNSWLSKAAVGSTATGNTFSNGELYIPRYSVAGVTKPSSVFSVTENNATTAYITVQARYTTNTSAITSLNFSPSNANNFVSGSSFFLYGIKNS